MNDLADPALQKVQAFVQGFFYMLPNLVIAAVVLLAFALGAWGASRTVAGLARRRDGRE